MADVHKWHWTLLVLGLSAWGSANDNVHTWTDRNIEIKCGMSSHEPNTWVSGTKVECSFAGQATALALEPLPEIEWERATVQSLRIECGDLDQTFPPPNPNPGVITKHIRIASTHFADGATIKFKVTVRVELVDLDDGLGTVVVDKVWEPSVKAYNRLEVLATKNSVPPTLSKSIALAAAFAFTDSHTITPGILNDPWRTKNQLSQDLRHSTFTFFSTHADMSVYEDSDGGSTANRVTFGENNGYLFDNRAPGVPSMNMAVMYSCATLDGTAYPWPISFGVSGALGMIGNKAYAGFTEALPNAWEGPMGEDSLYDHANHFITKLQEGSTIGEAAIDANEQYEPQSPLQIRGDAFARIVNVYLNAGERDGLSPEEINKWYRVF